MPGRRHLRRRSPAAAAMFVQRPNASRVRGAGPPRKLILRPKACAAPHPLQPIVRRPQEQGPPCKPGVEHQARAGRTRSRRPDNSNRARHRLPGWSAFTGNVSASLECLDHLVDGGCRYQKMPCDVGFCRRDAVPRSEFPYEIKVVTLSGRWLIKSARLRAFRRRLLKRSAGAYHAVLLCGDCGTHQDGLVAAYAPRGAFRPRTG